MANSFVITCSECEKQIKVTDELIGKKIRCKNCQHILLVEEPHSPSPTQAANKKKSSPASETKKPPQPKKPAEPVEESGMKPTAPVPKNTGKQMSPREQLEADLAEEDEQGSNPYGLGHYEEGVPRCPRCAGELAFEGAVICTHCGYNTQTRTMVETKVIVETTGGEKFFWLLPGILCVVLVIAMIIFVIIAAKKMPEWLIDTFLYNDEDKKWLIKPGAFSLYTGVFLTMFAIPAARFAYKRLVLNPNPPEVQVKM